MSESLIKQKKSESLIEQITLIALIIENKAWKRNLWNPLISVICDSDNVWIDGGGGCGGGRERVLNYDWND